MAVVSPSGFTEEGGRLALQGENAGTSNKEDEAVWKSILIRKHLSNSGLTLA